jgi:hypothetical protein
MPGRLPTGNIPTPMVRKSSAAHPAMKPVENMKSKLAPSLKVNLNKAIKSSETQFKNQMTSGKVKDPSATRSMIAKKTGVSPNGYTN